MTQLLTLFFSKFCTQIFRINTDSSPLPSAFIRVHPRPNPKLLIDPLIHFHTQIFKINTDSPPLPSASIRVIRPNPKSPPGFAALLVLVLIMNGCASAKEEVTQSALPPNALRIITPAQIAAGEPLSITVLAEPNITNTPILLIAQGSFGAYPQRLPPQNGRADFQLSFDQTRMAGTVTLFARAGTVETSTDVEIVPGIASDPVLPLVGPRSIVADGAHWTMVVTTPRDQYLNPVAENSLVSLRIQHPVKPAAEPASTLELAETRTQHLLSWKRIYSRTLAGESFLSASSGNAHSPERSFLEVPGIPVPFALSADRMILPADGRQLVRIRSELIKDRYGNILLDGSSALVLAQMKTGEQRSVPTQIIDGRMDLMLQAPKTVGEMTLQAWIAGISSQPLVLNFTPGPAVEPIPVAVTITTEEVQLLIGPLVGDLNQFIPDGSEVTAQISAPDGTVREVTAIADFGYTTLILRRITLASGHYRVSVQAGTGTGEATFDLP